MPAPLRRGLYNLRMPWPFGLGPSLPLLAWQLGCPVIVRPDCYNLVLNLLASL